MKKLFLIGNAHIDPVWLWRWPEGFAEIKATFKSAVDRMDENDDFVFSSACASYYKWVEENSPELFSRIKNYIDKGNWEITGGWWLQPDCNIPSGESFARHGLYSQRYFQSRFGRIAKVGYNVDSFGHNGMLPQILKKSGMDYYLFMRPMKNEKELPAQAFQWESPDGSRVTTFRLANVYNLDLNEERFLREINTVSELADTEKTPMMFFYGVGNHGGGPTKATIRLIKKLMESGEHDLRMSSATEYFQYLDSVDTKLPVVSEDLQYHASGCYSTTADIKKLNRKAENRISNAEKFNYIASDLFDFDYDRKGFETAWEDVLFNQFHDIMGGCSIKSAYDDAMDVYGEALKISADSLNSSLQKISWNINTMSRLPEDENLTLEETKELMKTSAMPVVVFNPNSWEATMPVTVRESSVVEDETGTPVETQKTRAEKTNQHRKWETTFMAQLPPLGYRTYWITNEGEPSEFTTEGMLESNENTIENDWYKLTFDKSTGWLTSLYDKKNAFEVLAGKGLAPVVIDDSDTDTWAHGVISFRNDIGYFADASLKLVESGPLRMTMRVVSTFGKSMIQQDFCIYRDIPDIEVSVKVNWQEQRKILKLSMQADMKDTTAVYEIPYGCIEKETDGVEEAGHAWFAVTGIGNDGTEKGLAITNDSKYSYDILGSQMRMTVLRSAFFADHFGEHDEFMEPMDIGVHYMKYSIIPFTGSHMDAGLQRKAMELNNPALVIPETFHEGSLPMKSSFLNIDAKNINVHALKMCEDDDSAILRCAEAAGKATDTIITFGKDKVIIPASFSPYEVKTLKISCDGVSEVNLLELTEDEMKGMQNE